MRFAHFRRYHGAMGAHPIGLDFAEIEPSEA
jgi:hypothetical protein